MYTALDYLQSGHPPACLEVTLLVWLEYEGKLELEWAKCMKQSSDNLTGTREAGKLIVMVEQLGNKRFRMTVRQQKVYYIIFPYIF